MLLSDITWRSHATALDLNLLFMGGLLVALRAVNSRAIKARKPDNPHESTYGDRLSDTMLPTVNPIRNPLRIRIVDC